jgi:ABC-2 type transport system permease protein
MMLEAFAYLFTTTWRNRLRRRLAQLRSPRYALALCVGVGYIALLLFRPSSFRTPGTPTSATPSLTGAFALASSVGLALIAAKWWLLGAPSVSLAFSPAEVQFLFPAPIRRRDLVLYRVLSTQIPLLLSAVFVTLVIRRGGPGLPAPLRIIGLWVLFSTLFLHQMAVTLVRTGAAERGRGLIRNAPALAVIGTAMLIMVVTIGRAIPPIHSFAELPPTLSAIGRALEAPLPSAVLAPFRWMLAPAYAHTPAIWARAIGPALAILALHYLWVLSADATFESAAVEASARRAARMAALRSAGSVGGLARATMRAPRTASRPWFPLRATGPAWTAILWKNTVNLTRSLALGLVLRVVAAITVLIIAFRSAGVFGTLGPSATATPSTITAAIALLGALYLAFLGPLAIRNDFRQDLPYLPVLRTFPLRGRTVVLAEILSPTVALSAIQIALLLLAYGLTLQTVTVWVPLVTRTLALAGAAVVLPLLNAVSFTIQNTLTLLFPAWSRPNPTAPSGFELMGQRLLAAFAALFALLIALVPPALVATVVAWLIGGSLLTTIAVCTVAAAATAVLELALAWSWLGRVYDRTDATVLVA